MGKLLDTLYELLPSSRRIRSDFEMTADSILNALKADGLVTPLTILPDFDSTDRSDHEIAALVFEGRWHFHRGTVLVHSPACSRYHLPDFECQADRLRKFVEEYKVEMLFDGDVIFLAAESRTLTVFHHEGAFAHFELGSQ